MWPTWFEFMMARAMAMPPASGIPHLFSTSVDRNWYGVICGSRTLATTCTNKSVGPVLAGNSGQVSKIV